MRKVIYVAGPYRAKSLIGVARNIYRAWRVARTLWGLGFAAVCPHTNTIWMSEPPVSMPVDDFLGGDLAILAGCDAILMMDTWRNSKGAMGELEYAKSHGIPAYFTVDQLIEYEL